MASTVEKLSNQFAPQNRYANFGPFLLSLDIRGIKGTNCNITFDFPVTAIAGYNGAGKSTIAQIALCMYRSIADDNATKRKYLKDFFMKTLLDQSPYTLNARIDARYATDSDQSTPTQLSLVAEDESNENVRKIGVHYAIDRWAGYKHQPQKPVYYYGMSYFIPYQEQNSNLLKDSNANIAQSVQFEDAIVKIVADILSIQYTTLRSNDITNEKRMEHVISATKPFATYSENHMGCGEGRLLKLVYALENSPDKSLFVIEEPETALHQLAQHKLAHYFLDVCERKKHQIIFTTHSPEIQRVLPKQARKYIQREMDGITSVVNSPSIAQIQNYLSGGFVKRMIIVTEDDVGKLYIKEILRAYSPEIFNNCEFFSMNLGYGELKKYVRQSQDCGMKIYGVVDEHRRADIGNFVAAFPEETAPELSFLDDQKTREQIVTEFAFNVDELDGNYHEYFDVIAARSNEELSYVKNRCIKLYIQSKGSEHFQSLIEQLELWLSECDK